MMDAFARLGIERCAAPDAEAVRDAYRAAAGASHPDHAADEAARAERTEILAALSEARATLLSPSRRLRHLLALEFPDFRPPAMAEMDGELTGIFSAAGEVLSEVAAVAARKRAASTFLAKAAVAGEALAAQERLESVQATVDSALQAIEEQLRQYDRERRSDPAELARHAQRTAFLEKWRASLQAAYASLI